ncbi:MAG: hypothetical protein K2K57_08395 [Oscillospiraceae bacterium]|nr:hypothetical protein [Oscillospiraceae bacterium]
MKILFINLPFSGHIIPTLGLVQELIKRGHKITYLLTPDWKEKILHTGAEFSEYQDNKKLSVQMRNAYDAAIKLAAGFDLVIYEQFFFLGKHAAEKFNMPAIRIFTSMASNESIMKEFVNAGGMFGVFRSKWVCRQWTKEVAKGIELKTDCWLKEILHNPPELNLVYTVRNFQPYAEDFKEENYKFLGASIYQRVPDKPFAMPPKKYPLIYISLGTIVNNAAAFYKKCIRAFEHENVQVIMSIGSLVSKDSLGKIPDNFSIYPFVPQLEVLENTDIFITHGGMNSVTESLYYGVPMIVIPFMTDQPLNAKRIEELHLGKKLEYKNITSEIIREATLSVMENSSIRQQTLAMKKELRSKNANALGADIIDEYMSGYC